MQELLRVMSNSTTLFAMGMSIKGLPVSADLQSITVLNGESVTDQIASYSAADRTINKFAGVVTGMDPPPLCCSHNVPPSQHHPTFTPPPV